MRSTRLYLKFGLLLASAEQLQLICDIGVAMVFGMAARNLFHILCAGGMLVSLSACAVVSDPAQLSMTPEALSHARPELEPSRTPLIRRFEVFTDQSLQTLREAGGGNFIHMFGGASASTDPVSEFNLQTLDPKVFRVSINLDLWEPENDDSNPGNFTVDQFKDEDRSFVRNTFEFMRKVKTNDSLIAASVWRVPGWLVENPEDESQQVIPIKLYPEVIESLAAWLLHARDEYGVEVDYISFNEANLGINVLLEPQDTIDLIRLAGPRFDELGLGTRWLLSDSSNMKDAASYAEAIWAAEDIRPYLGIFAFHSWDASAGDDTLENIGVLADRIGLEVWCTEGGWDPSMWQRPEEFPTWRHALNMAAVYTRVLKMTRATTLLYWQMMGKDYFVNDGSQPYPALTVIDAIKQYFPAGGQIVKTSADKSMIKFTAVKSAEGFTVVVVNQDLFMEQVQITGLPDGYYQWIRFSGNENGVLAEKVFVANGELNFELPKASVNFFTTIQ